MMQMHLIPNLQNRVNMPINPDTLNIIDFSPEWDYTTGGQKILICIKNPGIESAEMQRDINCAFGEDIVPV